MNNQITYDDKVALNENPLIPDINKCKADDMNEIKTKHNGCMNGSIPMGNVVVDSIQSKNVLNTDNAEISTSGITWTGSGATHYYTSPGAWGGGVHWFIPIKAGEKYTFSYKQRNSTAMFLSISERSQPIWNVSYILRSIVNDGTNTTYSFTIQNDGWLAIAFQSNAAVSNILFEEIQLEKGDTATSYSPYQNLNGYDIYSMGEIRIGTWINGKPLYRTCFVAEQKTGTSISYSYNMSSYNVDTFVKGSGIITNTASGANITLYIPADTNAITFDNITHTFNVYMNNSGSRTYSGYFFVEYTKTTN